MAEPLPPVQFDDIPLAHARTLVRGPRMDPELYHAFKEKIGSLGNTATRLPLPVKLSDHIFRGEVEVDLRGGQPIMSQDFL
jgi:hypothetical protein